MYEPNPHPLETRIRVDWPTESWCDSHVVLAVSSGPDSVAMLRGLLAIKATCGGRGKILVAHFNHGLRGVEADADEQWLNKLCHRLSIPLKTGRADETANAELQTDGSEEAARKARYYFLKETAEKMGARYVAVAHNADDQVETVLHRLLRGTGLEGLAGMARSRPLSPSVTLVRPLLALRRAEVLQYLFEIGQDYRVDSTNTDTRRTRNRLRHDLLPLLREQYNAGVDDALLRLASRARESQQMISAMAEDIFCRSVTIELLPDEGRRHVYCERLAGMSPNLVREVCRRLWLNAGWPMQAMGSTAWQQVAELILGQRKRAINLPGNIRARRKRDTVVLEPPH